MALRLPTAGTALSLGGRIQPWPVWASFFDLFWNMLMLFGPALPCFKVLS